MTTPAPGQPNYTLYQAQQDIATLKGQVAHLLANAALINVNVSGTLTTPDLGTWTSTGWAPAAGWQTPGSYNSQWASGSNDGLCIPFQFRHWMDGMVQVYGSFHTTGVTPGAAVFTLPSGYIPTNDNPRFVCVEVSGASNFVNFIGIAHSTGVFSVFIAATTSGTDYHVDGFYALT